MEIELKSEGVLRMSSYDMMSGNHFDESALHQNFMKVVYQVNNIACLLEQNKDGSFSAEYATPAFVRLMECDTPE